MKSDWRTYCIEALDIDEAVVADIHEQSYFAENIKKSLGFSAWLLERSLKNFWGEVKEKFNVMG